MFMIKNLVVLYILKLGSFLNKLIKGEKKKITDTKYFHLIDSFKKNGFVIIKNYLSVKDCDHIKDAIDKFCELNMKNIWSHEKQNEQRIFGAQNIDRKIEQFFLDKNIEDFASEIYNTKFKNMMVMANKINFTSLNYGSGSGWHRDSINYQFKAILYLSDVNERNGAFQFIKNTEKNFNIIKIANLIRHNVVNTRFSNLQVKEILKKKPDDLTTLSGKKGTLILVNTAMIHRGKPLSENNRYALTNYYYQSYKVNKIKSQFKPMLNNKYF